MTDDKTKLNILYVHMMGGVSLTWGRTSVLLNCEVKGRTMQLLLLLLLHSDREGISRNALLEKLYGRNDAADPSRNLRATVFRLRKLLTAAGFPGEECISTDKGIYRWTDRIPVLTDVYAFSEAAKRALAADGEERLTLLKRACGLYRGEFLPIMAEEAWAAADSARYRKLYFECLKEACARLKERGEYEEMLKLCTAASAVYPFEEWQVLQIDCLMAMRRYTEALKTYEDAASLFFEEMGLSPSDKMLARFRTMSGQIHYATGAITDIKQGLTEADMEQGAYYCVYPSFIDCYRLTARMIERSGQSVFLILCTITDVFGKPVKNDEHLPRYADKLHAAISCSLRRGDLYTRYSPNQFLVLLMGIGQESCTVATGRINRNFRDEELARKVRISYYAASVADFMKEGADARFGQCAAKWK